MKEYVPGGPRAAGSIFRDPFPAKLPDIVSSSFTMKYSLRPSLRSKTWVVLMLQSFDSSIKLIFSITRHLTITEYLRFILHLLTTIINKMMTIGRRIDSYI